MDGMEACLFSIVRRCNGIGGGTINASIKIGDGSLRWMRQAL